MSSVYWSELPDYDRITLRLLPDPASDGKIARVNVQTRPFADLASDGLPAPVEGDTAVVIRFSNAVSMTRSLQGSPEKTAVKQLTTVSTPDGKVWTVLGVAGAGCFAVQVPMWTDPSTRDAPFVDVTVDVQH